MSGENKTPKKEVVKKEPKKVVKPKPKATPKPKVKKATSKKEVVKLERNMNGGTTIHFKDGTKKKVDNNYIEHLKVKVGSKL